MIDFKKIQAYLLHDAVNLIPQWLPGGKFRGKEYVCADLHGGKGTSCSVNVSDGVWKDFASSTKGGDLLSLYAQIHGLKHGEAAKQLGFVEVKPEIIPATKKFFFEDRILGMPDNVYKYLNSKGEPGLHIAVYRLPDGRKQVKPWQKIKGNWVQSHISGPRPLYNLDLLSRYPDKPVLIVEGEKCAEAAQNALGDAYIATTWPGGAEATSKADWGILRGRSVHIWPDADAPGLKAAVSIYCALMPICQDLKIIDPKGQPQAWDIADAVAEGWDSNRLLAWISSRITINLPDGDLPPQEKHAMLWAKMGLTLSANKHPIPNIDNATKVLDAYPNFKGMIRYDEFKGKYITPTGDEWSDNDTKNALILFQRDLGMSRLAEDTLHGALTVHAHNATINEPKDWLDTLQWDGTQRISSFMHQCMGADDSAYSQSVSRNFWISLVARVYRPGCHSDHMVVLEGKQGLGKTKALRIIGGPWYVDMHHSLTDRDFYTTIRGVILVEIAELDAFSRVEVTRIKQVITSTVDRYREPYARCAQDFPRQCIFVGTTNEDDYLRDPTGARRFWPIKCNDIKTDLIHELRSQLFAESVAAFKNNEPWYIVPMEEALENQEDRRRVDPWEGKIKNHLADLNEISVADIFQDCLKGKDLTRLDMGTSKRIGTILRQSGWKKIKSNGLHIWRKGP